MNSPLFYCGLVALFFGSWPLIAKATSLNQNWVAVIVSGSTFVVAIISMGADIVKENQVVSLPPVKNIFLCLVAGAVCGLGLLCYTKLITWDGIDYCI